MQSRYRYLILGAGAAGLSLCCQLLALGIRDPILILDQKASFEGDRTWCFWNTRPNMFSPLAARCWHRWEVLDEEGQTALQESSKTGYDCLHGLDFYNYAQSEMARFGNVTLKLHCPVESVENRASDVIVQADGRRIEADFVFDSRLKRAKEDGQNTFMQRFFGQFIQTEQPVFDPSRCTLMDFQASQEQGLHFFYTLPFSPTEALIENTYIQGSLTHAPGPAQYREEINRYFAQKYCGTHHEVMREETGSIPMTMRPSPKRDGRIFFIGTAGGCSKPSSGYTFQRIQEQCRQIAEAAAQDRLGQFRERLPPARYRFFDRVFLQALQDRPSDFPSHFHRLFSRVAPEALTAFLSETSTWRSDLQIMRSLPLGPFLRAALRSVNG